MKENYTRTRRCCYFGAMIQALGINLAPLFFVTLREEFSISFEKIGRLVLITFLVQLCVDFLAVYFVDKWGYRRSMIAAHLFASAGLFLFGILPQTLPDAYVGMVIAVFVYSVGCGLLEVLISPTVDAIPADNKATSMAMVHAYYPLGQVLTILLTTVAVSIIGADCWWLIFLLWSLVPLCNLLYGLRAPFPPVLPENEKTPMRALVMNPRFWLMLLMMVCAGAAEMAMAQWASLFAEEGLGVTKLVGDLLGPCLFAVCMGVGRFWYGNCGNNIRLRPLLTGCSAAAVVCYLLAVFVTVPLLALLSCALCGLAVSLMWPGTLSAASGDFPRGGTALFALLALGGDLGCSLGPWVAGAVADVSRYGLKAGLVAAAAFPLLLFLLLRICKKKTAKE